MVTRGVAAGVSPALEPGILPGGTSQCSPQSVRLFANSRKTGRSFRAASCRPLRQPGWPPLRFL